METSWLQIQRLQLKPGFFWKDFFPFPSHLGSRILHFYVKFFVQSIKKLAFNLYEHFQLGNVLKTSIRYMV